MVFSEAISVFELIGKNDSKKGLAIPICSFLEQQSPPLYVPTLHSDVPPSKEHNVPGEDLEFDGTVDHAVGEREGGSHEKEVEHKHG